MTVCGVVDPDAGVTYACPLDFYTSSGRCPGRTRQKQRVNARCKEDVVDEVEYMKLCGKVRDLLDPVQHHVGHARSLAATCQVPA